MLYQLSYSRVAASLAEVTAGLGTLSDASSAHAEVAMG